MFSDVLLVALPVYASYALSGGSFHRLHHTCCRPHSVTGGSRQRCLPTLTGFNSQHICNSFTVLVCLIFYLRSSHHFQLFKVVYLGWPPSFSVVNRLASSVRHQGRSLVARLFLLLRPHYRHFRYFNWLRAPEQIKFQARGYSLPRSARYCASIHV